MKTISIVNPFATLIVKGFKTFETRTWPAPARLIGSRLVIASTANIGAGYRAMLSDETFLKHYTRHDLPENPSHMRNGFVLGMVTVDSVELMTEEMIEDVSEEERSYGHWEPGNYAWRLTDPVMFDTPVRVRGAQGVWDWQPTEGVDALLENPAAKVVALR